MPLKEITLSVYRQLERELSETLQRLDTAERSLARLSETHTLLQKSEERYRLMFENVPLGYMSMDENARLLDVNKAFADFFGYSCEEIVGRPFADFLAEGVNHHRQTSFPAFKRKGYAKNIVWNVRRKDGSRATIVMNGRVRYDEAGRFIQTHCMMLDITEHRKAEEALRKSESEKALILGAMSERVIYHGEDSRIIWANRVAAENAGITPEQMSGRLCYELLHRRPTPCEDCPAMLVFQTHRAQTGELKADGKILEMAAHPVFDEQNNFIGVVQIAADVTERRQLERELLELSGQERRRIGHDLHDGLGQQLTGISYLATALKQQLLEIQPDAAETAARIALTADTALKLMRSILQGLCLVAAEPEGLMSALALLATNTSDICLTDCQFSCDEPVLISDYSAASHLFYIAHEAVCNAVKHSGCSRIRINLDQSADMVKLIIVDNGSGIGTQSGGQRGMGLRTMRYRASLIGAQFEIIGAKDAGTTISCTMAVSRLCVKE
ncbi:MAG: PAS domain S-box protein [Desulfuromonadales bacterium]|nr:PAS domain S-box protein [Desulfuromonadales bacterium]